MKEAVGRGLSTLAVKGSTACHRVILVCARDTTRIRSNRLPRVRPLVHHTENPKYRTIQMRLRAPMIYAPTRSVVKDKVGKPAGPGQGQRGEP